MSRRSSLTGSGYNARPWSTWLPFGRRPFFPLASTASVAANTLVLAGVSKLCPGVSITNNFALGAIPNEGASGTGLVSKELSDRERLRSHQGACRTARCDSTCPVTRLVRTYCQSPCSRSVCIFPFVRQLRSPTKNASFDFPGYPSSDETSARNRSKHGVAKVSRTSALMFTFLARRGSYVSKSWRRKECSAKRSACSPTWSGRFQTHIVGRHRMETVPGIPTFRPPGRPGRSALGARSLHHKS